MNASGRITVKRGGVQVDFELFVYSS